MVWWSDPAVMDLCLGETGDGAGLPSCGQPQAKYLALNRCPWRRKNNDPPLDQEKSQSAFVPEAQSIPPFRHCLSILPIGPALPVARGLKSGKEATSAEQDVEGCGEGESYKQTYSNIERESEGREGRGVRGTEAWCTEREAAACTEAEKIEQFKFFLNVKYFGGESEIF